MAKSAKKVARAAPTLDTGRIEQIPFSQLGISPLNVRGDASITADDELVASIRAHGLLQPLVGYIARSGPAMILIAAGQRRSLALRHIAQPDTEIPVRIVDEESAIEVSLAENLERKDMNPADEVTAFQALLDTGHYDPARISSRFGFTMQYVRRRLKMAQLLPEILGALREGNISLDAATAYASASEEVQREIFKKHSAKGAWRPHEPSAIRQDIVLAGVSASSRVGKFIGGIEAYRAAGGTTIDEDFVDLFGKDSDEGRLRDLSVVRGLIEKRQADLQEQAEKLTKKAFPFASGVQWMDLLGSSYASTVPKPAKASGLVHVEAGWGEDRAVTFIERAKAAAENGATVIALVDAGPDGEMTVVTGKLLVGKDGWESAAPADNEPTVHNGMTPEEQAAWQRKKQIERAAANRYARTLIGETPGFLVQNVAYSRHADRLTMELMRVELKGDDIDFSDTWNPQLKDDVLAPFIGEATVAVDLEAEESRVAAEAKKKAQQRAIDEFDAKLGRLRATPIVSWPAKALVMVDGYALAILRMDGEPAMLRVEPEDDEPWETDDVEHLVEVIRDNANGADIYSIETFETAEDGASETPELEDAG